MSFHTNWHTMDSAPKDGSAVLLLFEQHGMIEGSWAAHLDRWEVLQMPSHGCGCCADPNPEPLYWQDLPMVP